MIKVYIFTLKIWIYIINLWIKSDTNVLFVIGVVISYKDLFMWSVSRVYNHGYSEHTTFMTDIGY